jgi:hypothetical protein
LFVEEKVGWWEYSLADLFEGETTEAELEG